MIDRATRISQTDFPRCPGAAHANPDKPYMRAADSPDLKELLTVTAVSKDGEPMMLRAEILRDGKTVKLDETCEEFGGAHFAFGPPYEVWKKPIPTQWG